jgi:predicted DsbA family dithiol-disulfide isomerase
MSERDFIDRVERDIAMARELDLVAVPSVLLDGELLSGVAGADLKARIQSAIERQDLVR